MAEGVAGGVAGVGGVEVENLKSYCRTGIMYHLVYFIVLFRLNIMYLQLSFMAQLFKKIQFSPLSQIQLKDVKF